MRFMMENNIMAAGEVCTAGSAILFHFKALFSAAVYDRCTAAGMVFAGLTDGDEFGIDRLFDSADPTAPAIDALLEDRCEAVLCNDIFGKLRRQAPRHGLLYIHPAYGTVSRFGLIPSVSSMDQIGVLCRSAEEGRTILSIISGFDQKDGTSLPQESYTYNAKETSIKLGVSAEFPCALPDCRGMETHPIELRYFDVLAPVFAILASAEISNNTTRYDGVKYGLRAENTTGINDLYLKTRTQGLGREVQLHALVGCMVLSQAHYDSLYHKAMQIRRLVKDYYTALLSRVDAIALPVQREEQGKYEQTALYALAALCGFSTLSFSINNCAMQLITLQSGESRVFSFAEGVIL